VTAVAALPAEVRRALQNAKSDLDWAVRMFERSATPDVVNIDQLVDSIRLALVAAKDARARKGPDA
jgi:hypothetical protein